MRRIVLTALAILFVPAVALANSCPSVMAEIDSAMATASLSEADMTRVQELRAQGEEQHNAGDHDASLATLGEAKGILGM
ncbi:hypothetical protein [Mesorhizobium xinjiangense]|uniref:hypothetical protein n=1 Tax=Mesorhizobium xinjiangense TaxID=2678685 RepID=UPI0012EE21D1|nr:hypothetical protein [Mesorhizobium xinjiangense]